MTAADPVLENSKFSESIHSVEVVQVNELSLPTQIRWSQLRESHPGFQSPYFDIEFTRAVDRIRDDVEVALAFDASRQLVGILPYQRVSRGVAEPVGGRLNDLHGVIGLQCDASEYETILKACRLKQFNFHALMNVCGDASKFEFENPRSYYIDLSNGFENYLNGLEQRSSTIKRHPQKSRALKRHLPNLKFEFDCTVESTLDTLIHLKRQKYKSTKTFDILSVNWASSLLRELHSVSSEGFQGILSVLQAGDQFVAGHFGMICGDILHYWFPVYDPQFKKYSPGTELILEVARKAASLGITKVDFGYGYAPYKTRVCDHEENVSCGQIRFDRLRFELAKFKYHFRNQLKKIPMKAQMKTVLRQVYPGFGNWNFR